MYVVYMYVCVYRVPFLRYMAPAIWITSHEVLQPVLAMCVCVCVYVRLLIFYRAAVTAPLATQRKPPEPPKGGTQKPTVTPTNCGLGKRSLGHVVVAS